MIIVKNPGYLIYKNSKFRCSLGINGIKNKKKEGDGITPKGIFKLKKISKDMGWCDDPKSKFYNKLIRLPSKFGHEKLYRRDDIYNLIIVLDYNMNPVTKNKGSAIFIHLAKKNYKPTQGCVGLKQNDLIKLVKMIKKNQKIKII